VIWLRASSEKTGETYDLESVLGTQAGDGGIAHGRLLVAFAEAVLGEDEAALAQARQALIEAAGAKAFVDAAAVAALFNAIDRVADSTGTPLEDVKAEASVDFRADLGINAFYSAEGKI
jgi:hypothetical protein